VSLCRSPTQKERPGIRLSERSRATAQRHFGMERFIDAYEEVYDEARGRMTLAR
jgi:hypothetical protein